MPYIQINNNMYWITDSNSKYYNKLIEVVEKDKKVKEFQIHKQDIDWKCSEHLYDYKTEYKYAVEIKYNEQNIKEKGSAIFLHVSNGKQTSGCVAISEDKMRNLLQKIEVDNLILISDNK